MLLKVEAKEDSLIIIIKRINIVTAKIITVITCTNNFKPSVKKVTSPSLHNTSPPLLLKYRIRGSYNFGSVL